MGGVGWSVGWVDGVGAAVQPDRWLVVRPACQPASPCCLVMSTANLLPTAPSRPLALPAEKLAGERVVPVFLSLDPQRDGVDQVRDYVKEFHPRMIGLTGPPERVTEAAKAYRVYFSKTQDSEDDYLIDHSIITYLVNPEVRLGWGGSGSGVGVGGPLGG